MLLRRLLKLSLCFKQSMVNLLMQLDDAGLYRIRHEFEAHDWELNCNEFVHVMQASLLFAASRVQVSNLLRHRRIC